MVFVAILYVHHLYLSSLFSLYIRVETTIIYIVFSLVWEGCYGSLVRALRARTGSMASLSYTGECFLMIVSNKQTGRETTSLTSILRVIISIILVAANWLDTSFIKESAGDVFQIKLSTKTSEPAPCSTSTVVMSWFNYTSKNIEPKSDEVEKYFGDDTQEEDTNSDKDTEDDSAPRMETGSEKSLKPGKLVKKSKPESSTQQAAGTAAKPQSAPSSRSQSPSAEAKAAKLAAKEKRQREEQIARQKEAEQEALRKQQQDQERAEREKLRRQRQEQADRMAEGGGAVPRNPAAAPAQQVQAQAQAQAPDLAAIQAQIAVLQQAFVAAGGANNPEANPGLPRKATLNIAEFSGPTEALSTELWLSNLARQQEAVGATDNQVLNAALCALKGTAGRWRQSMEVQEANPVVTDFGEFKTAFLKRFGKDRSATDLLSLLKNLNQNSGEPVRDFADRINLNLRMLAKALLAKQPAIQAQATRKVRDDAFIAAFDALRSLFFCSNLHESLRKLVEPKFAEVEDMEKLVELACEFERTQKQPRAVAAVAATEDQKIKALTAEINALKSWQRSTNPQNNTKQGQGQPAQDGKTPDQRRIALAKRIAKGNKYKFCTKCRQWGKHIVAECRAKKPEIAALTAMDPEVMPEGEPSDWFFDPIAAQNAGN